MLSLLDHGRRAGEIPGKDCHLLGRPLAKIMALFSTCWKLMVQICACRKNTLNPHQAAAFLVSAKSSSLKADTWPRGGEGCLGKEPAGRKLPPQSSCKDAIQGNTRIELVGFSSQLECPQFPHEVLGLGLSSEQRVTAVPSHQRAQAAWGGGDVDVVFLFSCFDNIVRRHIGKKKEGFQTTQLLH